MKTLKKLFSVSAIVALLGTLVPMYAFGANYSDELTEAYAYAYSNGITTMKSIDAADMYGSLTRVAMAKMIANYATTVLWLEPDTSAKCTFTDVTAALDAQYDNWVTKACQLGLMGQNITAFRPNDLVTRAEFGTTLSRALNHDSDDLEAMNAANPYYKDHLNFLKAEGIMNQIDNPSMTEVRGYVMLMMMRADEGYTPNEKCSLEEMVACALADDTDACLAACTGNEEPEEPVGNGSIKVSKVSAPAAQDVPANAVNVKVGTIKLTAGEYDTKVSSVEISRDGLATFTRDELEVALRWVNVETAYAGVSPSSNSVKVKFSPALVVKAGKSETFDVVVQMPNNTAANNTHNFKVTNVVVANWTASGYPITLWTIKTTSAMSKTVDVTVANWEGTIKAGDTEKLLWKVEVDFNKAAWTLNRFTLLNSWATTPTDKLWEAFDNIYAYVNDKKVGKVSWTDDKIIVSDLNISKAREENVIIELKADVIYSEVTANFKFYLDSIDVMEWNYWMVATWTLSQTADLVVNGSNITFKKVSLKEKDIIPWTKNVLVFDATFRSATDTTIKTVQITPAASAQFENILSADSAKLVVNWEEFDLTDAQVTWNALVKVSTNVDVDADKDVKVRIVLNTKNPTTSVWQQTISFAVQLTWLVSTENNTVSYGSTNKVNGDTVKISEWSLTIAAATVSAPVTRSLFSNMNQEAGRFSAKADGDKITLKQITLSLNSALTWDDISALLDGALTLVDVEKDSIVDATVEFDAADTNNHTILFKNMNYEIAADETVNLKLMADLWKIDEAAIGKTLTFSVSGVNYNTTLKSNIAVTGLTQALSTAYTLRITAPTIDMTKISDNQFKVAIKNVDEDNAIKISNLLYRVRTTSANSDFYSGTLVCVVEDVNLTSCAGVAWAAAFGSVNTWITTPVDLAKNETKLYYILVDGQYIEPDVLQATVSSLTYGTGSDINPESYNVTAK